MKRYISVALIKISLIAKPHHVKKTVQPGLFKKPWYFWFLQGNKFLTSRINH